MFAALSSLVKRAMRSSRDQLSYFEKDGGVAIMCR